MKQQPYKLLAQGPQTGGSMNSGPAPVEAPLNDIQHQRSEADALLARIAEALDSLGVAMCVFDETDHVRLWNRSLVRLFPEQAGRIARGEPYRASLHRFYAVRLNAAEMPLIEHYIDQALQRHHAQQRPFDYEHHGLRLAAASLSLPGIGRLRIWQPQTPPDAATALAQANALPFDGAALFDHLADGVMVTHADDRIAWVNAPFVEMYGLGERAAAVGLRFEEAFRVAWQAAVVPAERVPFDFGLSMLADHLRFAGAPFELPLPDARWSRVVAQRSADGRGFFMHVDITMLKRQQEQLLNAERRARESEQVLKDKSALLEATLERMEQGVMMFSAEGVVEVCNRRARELLDLPKALMDSQPTLEALERHQFDTGEFAHTPPELLAQMRARDIFRQPHTYDRKRPTGQVIEVSSVPTANGGVLRTYTDITERKRAEEHIQHIARHDGLTSLVNREAFLEHLSAAIADPVRRAEGFAVHFVDIDRFKPINDRHGHAIGDKVLALLAERMRLVARDLDVVARMGGDEFAVLQYQVDQADSALGLANRLRDGVASPMQIESHRLRVGASVGIALFHPSHLEIEMAKVSPTGIPSRQLQTADSMLRHADTAMYAAKASGGVRIFGLDGLDSDWGELPG